MTLRYGSVCSGIEAATMAWHGLGWSPAFFAEIEKFPSAVLAHHYGSNMPGEPLSTNGVPNHGDFTQIGADAGPVDLLVGGTPCQSFSVAGKRLGLDDPRGNLALEYLALARRLGARWIVWENVPGVLSSSSSDEPAEEGEEAEGLESADFATFLSFVQECGYGFAYRVLDAQYIRVDEHARATPQRRRRVFVVGYLGDWRRAAAVLLEPEGMRWDSAPRRTPGESIAPTISARPSGGGGLGTDFDLDGGLVAKPLLSGGHANNPLDENLVSYPLTSSMGTSASRMPHEQGALLAVPFDTTQITSAANYSNPKVGDPCHPLAAWAHPPAVAFQSWASSTNSLNPSEVVPTLDKGKAEGLAVAWSIMPQNSSKDYKARQVDVAQQLMAGGPVGGNQGGDFIQHAWAVRRLTPRECERLQRFPDNFTSVPFNGKQAADGPRYKALGNSMAVNVMRWLGQRIDIMENLIQSGALDGATTKSSGGDHG